MTYYDEFSAAVERGAQCAELFEIRNRVYPDRGDRLAANDILQRIGCSSPAAQRSDSPGDHEQYSPKDYRYCFQSVSWNPEGAMQEAGTDDPEEAARWYAEGWTGSAATAAYRAALDVFTGRESRHPE